MTDQATPAKVRLTDGLGLPPERADFEAWANVAGFGERDANGKFWFYRNGGDGMWEAYCAGAGDQRSRDAIASRDTVNALYGFWPLPEDAASDCLSALAGVETYDVNLRDHGEAWAAIEAFAAKVRASERARWIAAVLEALPAPQAMAFIAHATRA